MRVDFDDLELRSDQSYWYKGDPFEGIAFYLRTDGTIESEVAFVDGVQWGLFTDFHPNGSPSRHGNIKNGVFHGEFTYFDGNGKMSKKEFYEHGILLSSKDFDSSGNVVAEYSLPPDHPNVDLLAIYRRMKMFAPTPKNKT